MSIRDRFAQVVECLDKLSGLDARSEKLVCKALDGIDEIFSHHMEFSKTVDFLRQEHSVLKIKYHTILMFIKSWARDDLPKHVSMDHPYFYQIEINKQAMDVLRAVDEL